MCAEWLEVRLGDLVHIKHGWPFKSELFSEELSGLPIVVNIGNFQYTGGFRFQATTLKEYRGEYPSEYDLAPGDILLVMTCQTAGGEILGIPGRIPNDGRRYLHNQRLGKVEIAHPNVEPDFLYWLFLSKAFNRELVSTASGTKILHTAPSRIEAFKFRLPPLERQQAIARVLWSLENKIDLNRRMNQTLEAMAQAIFRSWFVDLNSEHGEAHARSPHGVGAKAPMWRKGRLDDLANVIMGSSPPGTSYNAAGIGLPLINGPVEFGEYYPKRVKWTTEPTRVSRQGDLVFCVRGSTTGRRVVADGDYCLGRGVAAIRAKGGWQAFVDLTVDYELERLLTKCTGSVFPNLSREDIVGLEIRVPDDRLLMQFESIAGPLRQRAGHNVRESESLASLRDALLPKLLSGEIRINDVEDVARSA